MPPNELRADAPMAAPRSRPAAPAPDPSRAPAPRPRRRGGFGRLFRALIVVAGVTAVVGGVAAYGLYREIEQDLPDHRWLADYEPPQMSRIFAADSLLTAELAAERRIFVPLEAIPPRVQQAFVSAEDQRFWQHTGVDPIGIARALITAVEQWGSGRRMGGASTITQQVAKNMLVGADRNLMRKVREAILAIRIEAALPKQRVLEIYLNEIFLGAQAYGVAAAAQMYFNKSLDELTLAEAAFLAALPKAPNNYNPFRFPEAARARRDWVLDRMAEDGAVTMEEARYAKAEPIVPRPARRPEVVPVGQHFTEEVRRELISRFGLEQTNMGGLVVRTSLEAELQAATEKALRDGLMDYDRRRGGWRGPVTRISAAPTEWLPQLEAVQRPGGMLPDWRLAVVLEVREREARVAWLERPDPRAAAQPRTMALPFEEVSGWARPVARDGRLGAAPRRMQDVLAAGDVVLVEPLAPPAAAPAAAQGRPAAGRGERAALRQIPAVEGAVVALDPTTGRVLAMAGGWSFERSQFNRATQALRQPGSSFKPFVYLPALEAGIPPTAQLEDAPVEVMTAQGLWRPSNYSGQPQGWVTMRQAMERSLNLVTIRVAQQVGIDRVAETARNFGVIPNMPRFLSMALGAGETTVLRMAAGYAAFVNGGREVTPTLIDSVQDRRGQVIWRADRRMCGTCTAPAGEEPPELSEDRRQVTDPIAAYQMVSLLTGVVDRGTGTRARQAPGQALDPRLARPIAGKTGTTDDYKDNWFVGFTPDIVIAVWIGFDEPRTLGQGETGGQNAAPIFRNVLAAALGTSPAVPFRAPPGVALVRVSVGNGSILEAFRPGTENATFRRGGGDGPGAASQLDSSLGGLY